MRSAIPQVFPQSSVGGRDLFATEYGAELLGSERCPAAALERPGELDDRDDVVRIGRWHLFRYSTILVSEFASAADFAASKNRSNFAKSNPASSKSPNSK